MVFRSGYFSLLRRMLRPALRFCLRYGIAFSELMEAIKAEYITLASEAAQADKRKVTVSQLSLMTGLNRREVTRLAAGGLPKEPRFNLASRVLGQWQHDARFRTSAGKPRSLCISGAGATFHELVFSVSKEINPASVLAELERTGAVVRRAGSVKMVSGHHSVRSIPERAIELLTADVDTLTAAVEENAEGQAETTNLHLRTEYDNVFAEDIPAIRKILLQLGVDLHRKVRELLAEHDKDLQPARSGEAGMKVVFGTFSWTSSPREKGTGTAEHTAVSPSNSRAS